MNTPSPAVDLSDLLSVRLSPQNEARLQAAQAEGRNTGPATWCDNKRLEARMLMIVAQLLPARMRVIALDLRGDFRCLFALRVPVPLEPDADGQPRFANGAVLEMQLTEQGLRMPVPGNSVVHVDRPLGVYHPNVHRLCDGNARQAICLGPSLMNIRATDLVSACYDALRMRKVTFDPGAAAGVASHEAALYWQDHAHLLPLTRQPFGAPEDGP